MDGKDKFFQLNRPAGLHLACQTLISLRYSNRFRPFLDGVIHFKFLYPMRIDGPLKIDVRDSTVAAIVEPVCDQYRAQIQDDFDMDIDQVSRYLHQIYPEMPEKRRKCRPICLSLGSLRSRPDRTHAQASAPEFDNIAVYRSVQAFVCYVPLVPSPSQDSDSWDPWQMVSGLDFTSQHAVKKKGSCGQRWSTVCKASYPSL
ncbi:hypothetical protein C8J56DRAFT_207978 [Mycena floridula]|nr:hypothetical protein C8J56DRAFT_207978 [Mycena floridula]